MAKWFWIAFGLVIVLGLFIGDLYWLRHPPPVSQNAETVPAVAKTTVPASSASAVPPKLVAGIPMPAAPRPAPDDPPSTLVTGLPAPYVQIPPDAFETRRADAPPPPVRHVPAPKPPVTRAPSPATPSATQGVRY